MCLYIADQSCSKHSWSNKLPRSWSWSHTRRPNWRGPIVGGCQEHGAFQLEHSSLGMCLGFDVFIEFNTMNELLYVLHRYSVFRFFCISYIFSSEKATRAKQVQVLTWSIVNGWPRFGTGANALPIFKVHVSIRFQNLSSKLFKATTPYYACFNCHDRFVDLSLYDRHIHVSGCRCAKDLRAGVDVTKRLHSQRWWQRDLARKIFQGRVIGNPVYKLRPGKKLFIEHLGRVDMSSWGELRFVGFSDSQLVSTYELIKLQPPYTKLIWLNNYAVLCQTILYYTMK